MSRCGRTGCSRMIEKDSFLLYNHSPLSLGLLPAINVILGEGLPLPPIKTFPGKLEHRTLVFFHVVAEQQQNKAHY